MSDEEDQKMRSSDKEGEESEEPKINSLLLTPSTVV
jgi:hypothetical protein